MSLRTLIKLAALASTCWMSVGQALAENRIALVIGNSKYTSVTALPNPANDAKAMTNFLNSAGFQVVQAVREREHNTGGHLPIIALTAHALASDREKAMEVGCDGYLAKPCEPRAVVAEVQRFLGRANAS